MSIKINNILPAFTGNEVKLEFEDSLNREFLEEKKKAQWIGLNNDFFTFEQDELTFEPIDNWTIDVSTYVQPMYCTTPLFTIGEAEQYRLYLSKKEQDNENSNEEQDSEARCVFLIYKNNDNYYFLGEFYRPYSSDSNITPEVSLPYINNGEGKLDNGTKIYMAFGYVDDTPMEESTCQTLFNEIKENYVLSTEQLEYESYYVPAGLNLNILQAYDSEEIASKLLVDSIENTGTRYANFKLPLNIIEKLTTSEYYKLQLETKNLDQSNYGIAKYINTPNAELINQDFNNFSVGFKFIVNDDKEYLYSTIFELLGNGIVLETSGEIIHNYKNTNPQTVIERYQFKKYFDKGSYQFKVTYKTINGFEQLLYSDVHNIESSPLSALPYIKLMYDKENATINIHSLFNSENENPYQYSGNLYKQEQNGNGYIFLKKLGQNIVARDLALEQNCSQTYLFENDDDKKAYIINTGSLDFDHAYLYDNEKQLCIKFNPKISYFKSVIQNTKITTIGAQFPYIFKNGQNNYKEFDISGLISYKMDENSYFFGGRANVLEEERESTINILEENDSVNTNFPLNLVAEEYYNERKMKNEVLEWLNNGKPKAFKSPTEGNYIVCLMDISLAPEEKLSRKLATFKCQAIEIAQYNLTELQKYNLLIINNSTISSSTLLEEMEGYYR